MINLLSTFRLASCSHTLFVMDFALAESDPLVGTKIHTSYSLCCPKHKAFLALAIYLRFPWCITERVLFVPTWRVSNSIQIILICSLRKYFHKHMWLYPIKLIALNWLINLTRICDLSRNILRFFALLYPCYYGDFYLHEICAKIEKFWILIKLSCLAIMSCRNPNFFRFCETILCPIF